MSYNNNFIFRFKDIETSLIDRGEYVERFDALSLSTVDIEDSNNTTLTLAGFNKLVSALTTLLNEAYIDQQTVLSSITKDIKQCELFISDNNLTLRRDGIMDFEGNDDNIEIIRTHTSNTSYDQIPHAPSDDNNKTKIKSEEKRRMETSVKQLQKQVRGIHDKIMNIYDSKLCAYEVITNCMQGYLKFTSSVAEEAVISNAKSRARMIIKPIADNLYKHRFLESNELQNTLTHVQELWSSTFLRYDDLHLAQHSLIRNNLLTLEKANNNWIVYLKMGAGSVLLLWSFSECFNNEAQGREIWRDPTFAIFMCFGDLLLLLWMWGISIQVWRKCGIDYVHLLGLEGTELEYTISNTPEHMVYSSATDLSLLFFVVFICFNKARRGVFGMNGSLVFAHAIPTIMVGYFIYRIIVPVETRKKWLWFLKKVLLAPFYPVVFRDGFIGDILTSLVRVLLPLTFSIAYLIMTAVAWVSNDIKSLSSTSDTWWQNSIFFRIFLVPFVSLFPLWIRLMQCLRRASETGKRWPHFANAAKYTSAIIVISFGTFQPTLRNNSMWIASFVFSTMFNYIWDLTMDWGIICYATNTSQSSIFGITIRQTKLMGPLWLYTLIMATNLLLRFAWATSLLPEDPSGNTSIYSIIIAHIGPLVAAGEILRRMVWGFLRLELEQLEVLGLPLPINGNKEQNQDYEKMDIVENKKSSPIISNEYSLITNAADRILSPSILHGIHNTMNLDLNQNGILRARFIESVMFCLVVVIIILRAAVPAFFIDPSMLRK